MKPFLAALLLSALVGGGQANGCGAPPDLENAICSVTGGRVGSWAYYTCNKGYILYGRSRILCTKNGWTKPSLSCQKIADPSTVSSDTVTVSMERMFRNGVMLMVEGHISTTQETIHSTDTGVWSHPPPNGTEIADPSTVSSDTVAVSMERMFRNGVMLMVEGHISTTQETIHSTDTGVWSHPPPNGTEIQCDQPPPISNGRVTEGEEWTYGAEASYSCDEGYTLTGQKTIHCTDTGAWSHPPPNCTVSNCGTPPDLENAICSVSAGTIGSWAFYTCNKGYILYGRNRILCTKNGWTKPTLSCQKIQCDQPPPISNGRVTEGEEWTYGAEASYSCDEGYTLTGQETIHCRDSGAWSHPPPICTEIQCDHPPPISNGRVTKGEEWTYGAEVNYSCDEGYTLTGQETIHCTDSGAWSHPPPNCTEIQCDQPPPISNGRVTEGEEWTYGAEASYSCDEGYTLTGQETIHCRDSGAWSHPPPICTEIQCDHPLPISNGRVTEGEEWTYGAEASYSCDEGYTLSDQETIHCTDSGAWSHPPPNCTEIQCDHPPPISNGRVTEGEEWTYGAEVNYSCDEGYTLTGQETIHCTDSGAWSHPPPNCTGTFVVYSATRKEFSSSFLKPAVIAPVAGLIFGVVVVLVIVVLIKRYTKQGSYRITLNDEEADSVRKLTVD